MHEKRNACATNLIRGHCAEGSIWLDPFLQVHGCRGLIILGPKNFNIEGVNYPVNRGTSSQAIDIEAHDQHTRDSSGDSSRKRAPRGHRCDRVLLGATTFRGLVTSRYLREGRFVRSPCGVLTLLGRRKADGVCTCRRRTQRGESGKSPSEQGGLSCNIDEHDDEGIKP